MAKPKSAGHSLMIKNAKKKKVSKSPYVKYPDTNTVRKLIGLDKNK
jgi:hypothetical protein